MKNGIHGMFGADCDTVINLLLMHTLGGISDPSTWNPAIHTGNPDGFQSS